MDRLSFTAAAYTKLLVSQRGVTESPPGSNRVKFAKDQGIDGQSWCAAFTGWGFDQLTSKGAWRAFWAGLGCMLPYYTPALADAARKHGLVVTSIEPGDLLFWDFPDSVHRVQHVDVALDAPSGGTVITIGGNTSSDDAGSQSNGGGVFERRRNLSSLVAAVRLPYAAPATAPAITPAASTASTDLPEEAPMIVIRKEKGWWYLALGGKLVGLYAGQQTDKTIPRITVDERQWARIAKAVEVVM